MEYKDKNITNESPNFWETMLLLTLERQGFVQILLLLKNCAKYCLDPEPEPEPQLIITVPQHWNPDPTFYCDADPDSNQSDANLQVPLGPWEPLLLQLISLRCGSGFQK
jgi:hypothetical protein